MDVSDVPYHSTSRGDVASKKCTRRNLVATLWLFALLIIGLLIAVVVLMLLGAEKDQLDQTKSPFPSSPYSFRVIAYNDVYEISPSSSKKTDSLTYGGAKYVASYLRQVRAVNPKTLVLLAGDLLGPSLMSQYFNGSQTISAQNSVGLNYACLGNHEFDFGREELGKRLKESEFIWLNANVYEPDNATLLTDTRASVVKDFGFVKVGIFGLMYAPAFLSSSVAVVRDPFTAAEREISLLRSHGASYVIALAHLPYSELCKLSLLAGLNLVVGGHDHEMQAGKNCGGNTPIVIATTNWRDLWDVTVDYQRPQGTRVNTSEQAPSVSLNNVAITNILPSDPSVAAIVGVYEQALDEKVKVVVGTTLVPLDITSAAVRQRENAFASFCLDYFRTDRWHSLKTDIDVALCNGGDMRGNNVYPSGDLTLGDILTIYPFPNQMTILEVSGKELRLALEEFFSKLEFPQISGIQLTLNLLSPPGSRVANLSWTKGHERFSEGAVIAENDQIVLVTSQFLFGLLTSWSNAKSNSSQVLLAGDEGPLQTDLILRALEKNSPISPQVDGRIVLL